MHMISDLLFTYGTKSLVWGENNRTFGFPHSARTPNYDRNKELGSTYDTTIKCVLLCEGWVALAWLWLGSFHGNELVFIEMHLGFRVTHECDPMVEDGPRGGHPRDETRMTCGVSSLAQSDSWNVLYTISRTSMISLAPSILEWGSDTYLFVKTTLDKFPVSRFLNIFIKLDLFVFGLGNCFPGKLCRALASVGLSWTYYGCTGFSQLGWNFHTLSSLASPLVYWL